jgi:outer membrane receptor protein involved in Fe transport
MGSSQTSDYSERNGNPETLKQASKRCQAHLVELRVYRAVLGWFILLLSLVSMAQAGRLSGHVVDTSGAAISNARVQLRCGNTIREVVSAADGSFTFDEPRNSACIVVASHPGFASGSSDVGHASTIQLNPTGTEQSVTVTASRTSLATSDLPITGVGMNEARLQTEPALTMDDKLRQVPGFALFRRSGSQTANPTSQGVSLRGLGASGASRSLVLLDGVPVNDPFGGWVYWGRVPLKSVEQIDIVEGGVSDLYGSNALGGVINLRTRDQLETTFAGESSYGSMSSPFGSFLGSVSKGQWGATFAGEDFSTNGYIPVEPSQRGPVDRNANSEHRSGDLLLQREFKNDSRVFLRGGLYGESRRNGTRLQVNQATVRQLQLGTDWNSQSAGAFRIRLFGGTENLHQTFSSINSTRSVETLTVDQRVPVSQYGFSGQWSRVFGRHMIAAGVDGRDVMGDTNEHQYTRGTFSSVLIAGGRQQTVGVFAEDVWQITPRWLLSGSLRGDRWANADASSRRFPVVGVPVLIPFANRSETAVSPRAGVTRVVSDKVSIYASAYRSFRAPTLNELYRSFRVGNVLTQANSGLKAEHFTGGELGTRIQLSNRVRIRATGFGGFLDDAVGNVTLTSTPTLITRRRQNIGQIRLRGVELGTELKITNSLLFDSGYQLTDSTVRENGGDPTLVGKMTPLVPRHAVTFAATYANPRVLTVSFQGRSNSTEYDDDQNTLPLDPYFNLGVYVARELKSGFEVFFASENLLNSAYEIGRTPVPTLGSPRSLRAGLRFQIGEMRAKRN